MTAAEVAAELATMVTRLREISSTMEPHVGWELEDSVTAALRALRFAEARARKAAE